MKRQALVIGINRYPYLKDSQGNTQNLTYPAGDAAEIDRLLRVHGNFEVRRLPETFTGDAMQVDEMGMVNKDTLQREISKLFNPDNGDVPSTALLFFAGHGLQEILPRNKCKGYLATSEADNKNKYGVPFDWLVGELIDSSVKEQIVWLDCCHSGEFTNLTFAQADAENMGQKNVNRLFIAACRESETAYGGIKGHGLLTYLLLKGLDPAQNTKGEWITSTSLNDFVHNELIRDPVFSTFQQRFRSNCYGEQIKFWQKLGQEVMGVENASVTDEINLPSSQEIVTRLRAKSAEIGNVTQYSKQHNPILQRIVDDSDIENLRIVGDIYQIQDDNSQDTRSN
jgi:uncharacterized caspase-like protein